MTDIKEKLNKRLLTNRKDDLVSDDELNIYKNIAKNYADVENSIAVLSDTSEGKSYIFYGGFINQLSLKKPSTEVVPSIWEDNILDIVHPDDIKCKYLEELYFYNFVSRQVQYEHNRYCLYSKLRMRDKNNNYISVLHRIFYFSVSLSNVVRFALCIYSPLSVQFIKNSIIVDTVKGECFDIELDKSNLLSSREKQILKLISIGMMSKHIADFLSISINTVNRHRQQILAKLHTKNSIEACRVAKEMNLI